MKTDQKECSGLAALRVAALDRLTTSCSEAVKSAVEAHLAAGRPVYGQDRNGQIVKMVQ